jgi:hypothetical protein
LRRIAIVITVGAILSVIGCAAPQWMPHEQDRFLDASKVTHSPETSPIAPIPPEILIDRAVTLIAEGEYDDAMVILEPITEITEPAQQATVAEASLWVAYCYERQGNAAQARVMYQTILKRWPDTLAAGTARDLLTPP